MPAASSASSGGVGLPTGPPTPNSPLSGNPIVTVSGNGITLATHTAGLLRGKLWFKGTLASDRAGQALVIERRSNPSGANWIPTVTATTGSGGSFVALWRVNHAGSFTIRAVLEGSSAGSPTVPLTVYRPSIATLYGPGFYGHHTACGLVLKRHTLGVANRTLPCGTPISIYYRGQITVVPVIDRGPYSFASWDLTEATGGELGMAGTSTIGALSVPAG